MVLWLPIPYFRGMVWVKKLRMQIPKIGCLTPNEQALNPLREHFDNITEGPGVWKWSHYFSIYHNHMEKFVGKKVTLAEIGVYSGGSMKMWRAYLGDQCHIHGVDIAEECRVYESENASIHIGDQEDRQFWSSFQAKIGTDGIDVLIDDGGHTPEQQIVTLEEMLPYLNLGGVYICEDITGTNHSFRAYVNALVNDMNSAARDDSSGVRPTPLQQMIHSVHFYPYVVVIERHLNQPERLMTLKHGTEWQPFLQPSLNDDNVAS